jgi:uncharacterized protein (DUF433 family)
MPKGITINPEIQHGQPVVAGTRTPIVVILSSLASGMTKEEVMRDYDLTEENMRDVMAYAAQTIELERTYFISA